VTPSEIVPDGCLTVRPRKRIITAMQLRSLLGAVLLVAMAAKLAEIAVTREGVGPFEYLTVVALVGLLLVYAFRLSRRAIRGS
jgi:hypothetical protein